MTPGEKTIAKSLIAVAWADGEVAAPEAGIIDGLIWAFGAGEEEERELREYASTKRTLDGDLAVDALSAEEKELLLAHAALLTHADGEQSKTEQKVLTALVKRLGMTKEQAAPIIATAKQRTGKK